LTLSVLPYFDGRANEIVTAQIEEETGIVLALDLIQRLVDFRVLVDAGAPSAVTGRDGRTLLAEEYLS